MHCSMRVPLESSYQDGNPLTALTGPTAERPVPAAGALAASAAAVRLKGTATAAVTTTAALRHGRRRWRHGASRVFCWLMKGHSALGLARRTAGRDEPDQPQRPHSSR